MSPDQDDDDHVVMCKAKSCPLFSIPNPFVALSSKVMPDYCESSRSPTSHFDHKLFSNTLASSPKSTHKVLDRDCGKVGLGLVKSLTDETKNIVFGSRMRTSIPSTTTHLIDCLRDSFHVGSDLISYHKLGMGNSKNPEFELREFGKMGSLPVYMDPSRDLFGSMSASEIELSEDYTCIISHGPNPKTTHIFGDTIIESLSVPFPDSENKNGEEEQVLSWVVKCSELPLSHCSSGDSVRFCFFCKKKLDEGKDINMCRNEKAFCCCKCREILNEKETEKDVVECSVSPEWSFLDEIFPERMADAL